MLHPNTLWKKNGCGKILGNINRVDLHMLQMALQMPGTAKSRWEPPERGPAFLCASRWGVALTRLKVSHWSFMDGEIQAKGAFRNLSMATRHEVLPALIHPSLRMGGSQATLPTCVLGRGSSSYC